MNKHFLKNIRDNMPEPLKYITGQLFRNKIIKNSEYCRFINTLAERESLGKEEIKEYQFVELKKILTYSYKYVPYYTELFNKVKFDPNLMKSAEDILVIPFLTKEIIRNNFGNLISTQKVKGGHYAATTGGSTGEPLTVLLDCHSIFKENAFVNHFRKKLGYNTKDRLATFRGVEFGEKLWKFNPMQNELIFSPFKISHKTISAYVDKINKFQPSYLNGYLSSLTHFSKLLSGNNLKLQIPIKGIFLISENIDKEQRKFLEKSFKVRSSTFYGHSERCIIAEEVLPNEYVFDPYYGYTELIGNGGLSFTIIGTGFLNRTMPLIRYKTDDVCYSVGQRFSIDGRWESTMGLYGINGEFFAHAAFNFHSGIFKNIANYQFVQTKKGKSDLLLVVIKGFEISEIDFIKKEIDKKTKGVIDFNVKVTDHLILSNRGKYKRFISNIKE